MTRRVLIWAVAYGVAFVLRVLRHMDIGDVGELDGTRRPALDDGAIERAHADAVKVANLAADRAEGSGPT